MRMALSLATGSRESVTALTMADTEGNRRASMRSWPLTIRAMSSNSATSRFWMRALLSMISRAAAVSASRLLALRRCVHASTAARGVRSSCESIAKNSSRFLFACSATSRARRSAERSRAWVSRDSTRATSSRVEKGLMT